ncbi:MAG: tRNA pseudouridine(38-40) synthase TruA [Acidobacteriota bacterium]
MARKDPIHHRTRLRLDLAFAGTGLQGWQAQARGTTVQGLVDAALSAVGHRGPRVVGCSRTDSGVHARAFTAHVDATFARHPEATLKGLNANLPPQIRVYRVSVPGDSFHARYSCSGKTYRYHLCRGAAVPPFLAPYVWAWRGALDLSAVADAARLFLGEHDFSAFTTSDGRERNPRRTLTECRIEERGDLLCFHVSGASFLHRMVRCIVGLLLAVGGGRVGQQEVRMALSGENPGFQIPALPAQGLVLWEVVYPAGAEAIPFAGSLPREGLFPIS